ncbi:hypothetical protein NDU88_005275 [Pleurodeles waltl]|uniref:Uncharacterized protein n=1 Tax=Pleurodeles waltl TaxID=8319 RepID=A0AAV7VL70_PLEWA|nr:hypothetical protein NDU88_005275 [Pleurodeles waltl]
MARISVPVSVQGRRERRRGECLAQGRTCATLAAFTSRTVGSVLCFPLEKFSKVVARGTPTGSMTNLGVQGRQPASPLSWLLPSPAPPPPYLTLRGSRGLFHCHQVARWEIRSHINSSRRSRWILLRPSSSPDRAPVRGEPRRAVRSFRRAGISPLDPALAISLLLLTPRERGVPPPPLGCSRGAGWSSPLRTGTRLPPFESGAQPIRSPEAAAILIPRSRRGHILFSLQPLFVAHQHFHRICRAVFHSLKRILPLVLGAWRC